MSLERNRVLVIDDDPEVLALHTMVVEMSGYQAISCSNSAEAESRFEKNRDRLATVMSDRDLREAKTGLDIGRMIKEEMPCMTVILVTGTARAEIKLNGDTEVDIILTKPVDMDLIEKTLNDMSRLSEERRLVLNCGTKCCNSRCEVARSAA